MTSDRRSRITGAVVSDIDRDIDPEIGVVVSRFWEINPAERAVKLARLNAAWNTSNANVGAVNK